MRILLMGARGMLGADIVQDWTSDELVAADSRDADIRNLEQVRKLVSKVRPNGSCSPRRTRTSTAAKKTPSLPLP